VLEPVLPGEHFLWFPGWAQD